MKQLKRIFNCLYDVSFLFGWILAIVIEKNVDMISSINLHPEYDQLNSLYKLEEKGNKFYLPSKSLQLLEKYYDSFIPTSKQQAPSIISWYNSLSRSQQADILVVSKS